MTRKQNAGRWEAYILLFGAIVGFCCYTGSPLWLWLFMGLVGLVLLKKENRKLRGGKALNKLWLMDGAALLLSLLWGALLPSFLGVVKMLLLAVPAAVYISQVFQKWIPFYNE